MSVSKLIALRLSEKTYKQACNRASELGYIKPNGDPNISEYIRNLIINAKKNK